jgi:Tetratricopeptide repeat
MTVPSRFLESSLVRLILGAIAIVALCWAMIASGRIAISRIFVKFATTILSQAPEDAEAAADSSISSTPKDAEAHWTRGIVANYMRSGPAALREFELAVSLRPRDYYLWLELGLAQDQEGNQQAALASFNESIRLAPFYAQPRWLRGNLLFRLGRYDEAFADLRQAAVSNPELLPALIDLSWGAAKKDAGTTEKLLQPLNETTHYELAMFFANHDKPDEALAQFRSAGAIPAEFRRKLVKDLLAAGATQQAFDVWRSSAGESSLTKGSIFDGGFEGTLNLDESGFGWRLASTQSGVAFSLDGNQPDSGTRSLRITLTGHTYPAVELVSQLIPVEPNIFYKLSFAARTANIVTGGPLIVVVHDPKGKQTLAHSPTLPATTTRWQTFSFDFETRADTQTIVVSLQRENCTTEPCPVFGDINLDSFSLQRVNKTAK